MADEPTTCAHCGGKLIPIVYGFPSPELMESARRGEFALGGCTITGDDPHSRCSECGRTLPERRRRRGLFPDFERDTDDLA